MVRLENQLTVVVCGDLLDCTIGVVSNYLENPRINRVIYSGWGRLFPLVHPKLTVVYNEEPKKPGIDNRNRQIVCSYFGLNTSRTDYSWRVRSDQVLSKEAINECIDHFEQKYVISDTKLFVSGILGNMVMAVRSDQTFGRTQKVKDFWQCPLDEWIGEPDYTKCLRTPSYLTCHFLMRYSSTAFMAITDGKRISFDNAPKRQETINSSRMTLRKQFMCLPKVPILQNHMLYDYEEAAKRGEYWDFDAN